MLISSAENPPLLPADKVIEVRNKHGKVITDKNDLIILVTALEAEVYAIVTGDKHFDNLEVRWLYRTDNGLQFIAKKFQKTCEKLEIKHQRIPASGDILNNILHSFKFFFLYLLPRIP